MTRPNQLGDVSLTNTVRKDSVMPTNNPMSSVDRLMIESEAIERALRIRIWNELRERGVSQDKAIQEVNATVEAIKTEALSLVASPLDGGGM